MLVRLAPKNNIVAEQKEIRRLEDEFCPICNTSLTGIPTGFYAVDGVLQKACIPCIKEKQKGMIKWIILGLAIGFPLAYFVLFVLF